MGSAALTVVPDEDEPGCATVLVDVELDGRPERFGLDTGARTSQVQLTEQTAAWPVVERRSTSGIAGTAEVDVVLAPSLGFAGETMLELPVHRMQGGVPHGLLGLDVLGRFVCTVDWDAGEVRLEPTSLGPWPHRLARGARGHLFVTARWGTLDARACLDFGADISLVDEHFAAAHPELVTLTHQSTGFDITGAPVVAATGQLAPYRVDDLSIAEHVVAVAPLTAVEDGVELVLGYPALVQANWTFDLPGSRYGAVARPAFP